MRNKLLKLEREINSATPLGNPKILFHWEFYDENINSEDFLDLLKRRAPKGANSYKLSNAKTTDSYTPRGQKLWAIQYYQIEHDAMKQPEMETIGGI